MMVVCVAAMFALVSDGRQTAKPVVRTPYVCYDVLDRAYVDGRRIERGMTRRQVEEKWYEDGGMQLLGDTKGETRYVYRDCDSLKIRIEFQYAMKTTRGPEDTVIRVVSPVYVERASLD